MKRREEKEREMEKGSKSGKAGSETQREFGGEEHKEGERKGGQRNGGRGEENERYN